MWPSSRSELSGCGKLATASYPRTPPPSTSLASISVLLQGKKEANFSQPFLPADLVQSGIVGYEKQQCRWTLMLCKRAFSHLVYYYSHPHLLFFFLLWMTLPYAWIFCWLGVCLFLQLCCLHRGGEILPVGLFNASRGWRTWKLKIALHIGVFIYGGVAQIGGFHNNNASR